MTNIPMEGVAWLILSLLCWWCADDVISISTIVTTTFHLIVCLYVDVRRRKKRPSSQTEDDQRPNDDGTITTNIWRNSSLSTTSNTTSTRDVDGCCDYDGKYMSIALLPILLESMNILSKQQQQQQPHQKYPTVNVSVPLQNVAFTISVIQIAFWNIHTYYVNHTKFWMQRKSHLYIFASMVFVLLLLISFTDIFPYHNTDDQIWFTYIWITMLFLFGPYQYVSLQGIMTYGEWLLISSCLSYVTTFIWTTVLHDMKNYIFNESINIGGSVNGTSSRPSPPLPTMIYAYTATSGLLGCIIACSTVNICFQYTNTNQMLQLNYPNITKFIDSSIITNLLRIVYISLVTLGIVECTFWYSNITPQHTFPKCLWWIFYDFLLQSEVEDASSSLDHTSTIVSEQHSYLTQWFPLFITKNTTTLPRISWLMYWFTTMLITIPLAPSTTTGNNRISPVIARKWFHFIALLLFIPTTIIVPQLQSLSYAIAICVLLIIEVIRIDIPILNEFYYIYLDHTKDEADNSKFVISHIALVAGCAIPLWIIQYYNYYSSYSFRGEDVNSTSTLLNNTLIIGLWGVYVLGIGDAMGALIGKSIGRYKWGSNSRTMEGSMAMCTSLCISCIITNVLLTSPSNDAMTTTTTLQLLYYSTPQWLPAVVFVTLIEAYTLQIDNIVLPLAGIAMMFVCHCLLMKFGSDIL